MPHRALLLVAVLSFASAPVCGQTDAERDYQLARQSFAAQQYEAARDLLIRAAQTDRDNPDIHLWLGRAHHALGAVDEALTAWRRTLELAPGHAYAQRMVDALTGWGQDVAAQLDLVRSLLAEELVERAADELEAVVRRGVPAAQRGRVLALEAELAWRHGDLSAARVALERLAGLEPERAATPRARWVLAQVWLGDEATAARGRAALERLANTASETVEGRSAQLDLVLLEPVGDPALERLGAWLDAHGDHPRWSAAAERFVARVAAHSASEGPRRRGEDLAARDRRAASIVRAFAAAPVAESRRVALLRALLEGWRSTYAACPAAVADAIAALEDPTWPASTRILLREHEAGERVRAALTELQERVAAGTLGAERPASLEAALAALARFEEATSAVRVDRERLGLARALAGVAGALDVAPGTQRAPRVWAGELALAVLVRTRDPEAFAAARDVVTAIAQTALTSEHRAERAGGLAFQAQLAEALPATDARFADLALVRLQGLAAEAGRRYQENVAERREHENGSLTDLQRELATQTARIVRAAPAARERAFQVFQGALAPWIAKGPAAVVDEAFAILSAALGDVSLDDLEVARLDVWVSQVRAEHARFAEASLRAPEELGDAERRAFERAYALIGRFAFDEARRARVLQARASLLEHHRVRRSWTLVEAALAVRAEPPVAEADALAALDRARLRAEIARLELMRARERHGEERPADALPETVRAALDAWLAFLRDHAGSRLRSEGLAEVVAFAHLPRRIEARTTSAALLRELEAFFAAEPAYAAPSPNASSLAARMALARAEGLAEQAGLEAANERSTDGDAVPSAATERAWSAYRHVLETYGGRPEVRAAVDGLQGIARQHVAHGRWEVAALLFERLEDPALGLARRGRFTLARALCELGRVLPDAVRPALVDGRAFRSALPASEPGPAPGGSMEAEELVELEKDVVAGAGAAPITGGDFNFAGRGIRGSFDQNLALLHQRNADQARRIAALRDDAVGLGPARQAADNQREAPSALSAAEIERRAAAFASVYETLLALERADDGEEHREQIVALVTAMVDHWREVAQWRRAADFARRFLADHPRFRDVPAWRFAVARDELAWAATPPAGTLTRQAVLDEVLARFAVARRELESVAAEATFEAALVAQAQWSLAESWWTQARVIAATSSTLARGQFVRAATELGALVRRHPQHPRMAEVPGRLVQIGNELAQRGFHVEAIGVWSDLRSSHPTSPFAAQVARGIAETYRTTLDQPLRAVDAYLELEFAEGSDGEASGNVIFQIAQGLQGQKRWIETLHVLETFVDSFPRHALAGQALTMIGQVHEANEAWEEALAAYRRVVTEYGEGSWLKEARWSIANGTINLSRWREAIDAYREFTEAWSDDSRVPEAQRRIVVLKDLARYQDLVDEPEQRKAFDAQYQIGRIVHQELGKRLKAILEFRKVAQRWPESHLADDALYQVGLLYLEMGETERSREALLAAAQRYPGSPLADDAWFLIGTSFEQQAEALANVTRDRSLFEANDLAQREAYKIARGNRAEQRRRGAELLAEAKKRGEESDATIAYVAAQQLAFDNANISMVANWVGQQVEVLSAAQLADRRDKIHAALRRAVENFARAAAIPTGDKNAEALLRMAKIYDERLDDREAAMATWVEIATQYSGTAVAADASWKIAQVYERQGEHQKAIDAYTAYLRNYRRSERAADAQFAIAEGFEHLGKWVEAMDAYTKYVNNFPEGSLVERAKEQINWIKTYRL